jgi:hypothetical protein
MVAGTTGTLTSGEAWTLPTWKTFVLGKVVQMKQVVLMQWLQILVSHENAEMLEEFFVVHSPLRCMASTWNA